MALPQSDRGSTVLSETPMFAEAMKLCWKLESYKSQVAVVIELLQLQQSGQIPPEVTSEDIMDLLLEESKKELREGVFNFEHDGVNGGDGMPTFMMIWNVNTGNKIRDIMLEAKMLFSSPWAIPTCFQNPEDVSKAQEYAKILREKSQEASSPRLFSPQQVVEEIVPRVLQIFWVFHLCPHLDMPSRKISTMSVVLTSMASEQISRTLRGVEQVPFSHRIRNDMVLSILIEIKQMYPVAVLLKKRKDSSAEFLIEIMGVALGQICQMFELHRVAASPTPSSESSATSEDDTDHDVSEQEPSATSARNCCFVAVVQPSPFEHTPFAPPPSPSEPPSPPLPTSPSEPPPLSPLTPHSEPPSFSEIQAREEVNEESIQENPPNSRRRTQTKKSCFQKLFCCFAGCDSDTDTE